MRKENLNIRAKKNDVYKTFWTSASLGSDGYI